jgi:chromosome segregation ATPase
LLPKRITRTTDESSAFTNSERHLILAAESLRAGDTAGKERKDEKGTEEKMSLFWRVFGGTILSITALTILSAYQSLAGNIHEVRTDLGRLRESSGDFIKKDEFNNRSTNMWNGLRDLQAVSASVTVLTSKLSAVEQQVAAADRERRDMQTTLSAAAAVKDRLGALEDGRRLSDQDHKDLLALGVTLAAHKDRDSTLEKNIREAEAERRELVRELQQLRERLAKLEGLQEGKPAVKPAVAAEKKSDGPPH